MKVLTLSKILSANIRNKLKKNHNQQKYTGIHFNYSDVQGRCNSKELFPLIVHPYTVVLSLTKFFSLFPT